MRIKPCTVIAAMAAGAALLPVIANARTLTTLYSFKGGSDGSGPNWVTFHGGKLYGTTASGNGTVFELNLATMKEAPLYAFQGGMDGSFPNGLYFENGALYGTTGAGGGYGCVGGEGCGTLFEVDPKTGAETVVVQFSSSSTGGAGGLPQPGLTYARGNFFGITEIGGDQQDCSYGCGTVFTFTPQTGIESPLYDLVPSNGYLPAYGVIDVGNTLYGTTTNGGASDGGTIFSYDIDGKIENTLYSFTGAADGIQPQGQLIYKGGRLYGAMRGGGGACSCGTLFVYDIARTTYSVMHNFAGGTDGSSPTGPTILHDGTIYGTTEGGGGSACGGTGCGTIFAYDLQTKSETILHRFTGGRDGSTPYGLIYQGGNIYGVTESGGAQGFGTVFELTP
jgi:uncharacterized repeat protein (TIGR03803 family)